MSETHGEPAPATGLGNVLEQIARPAFINRLVAITLSFFLMFMTLRFLQDFRTIMQPLLIAVFIGYLILPIHRWLVERGVPSILAYLCILVLILAGLFGFGAILYRNAEQAVERWPDYQSRIDSMLLEVQERWFPEMDLLAEFQRLVEAVREQAGPALQSAMGTFFNFFTGLAVTFIYLVFLVAEKVTLPNRISLAFGETRSKKVMEVVGSINDAIAEYISVKTFISVAAGIMSMAVLAVFQLDFFITWGLLIFLLNYIPYLGSLVAIALPIGLSFLQLGVWQGIVIAILLIAIQQFLGTFVEPKMAGRKLGVSPLLIILSLSFWGVVWGIIGMILAVPLLVTLKIVLDNIPETKPVATLMSNQ